MASLIACKDNDAFFQDKILDTLRFIVGDDMDEFVPPAELNLKGLEDGFHTILYASKNYIDHKRNPFLPQCLGNVVLCLQNCDLDGFRNFAGLTMKEITSLPAKFTFPNVF